MGELLVIRHGQAAFGSDNYDRLSDLGRRQAALAGDMLRQMGWVPDLCVTGTLTRQIDTATGMGFAPDETHGGFNEYDFHDLLRARFGGEIPHDVRADRKTHFRTLRDTVLAWQSGDLNGTSETYQGFAGRVEAARASACRSGLERVLVVSSGGVIGQLAARAVQAPDAMMMTLNLQVKNTSFSRFVFTDKRFFLSEFNATPQFAHADTAVLSSYS
ncbi:MAG: histidine phosphatase family protein [Marinibacterium sp.]|nr:histidine phosphatase family protein [Marinibacterium sp.]